MNGDLADRLVADMRAGRRVLVLSDGAPAARAALEDVASRLAPGERARRGHGREGCFGAGRVGFQSVRSSTRGYQLDTVVFDEVEPTKQQLLEVMPALAASPHAEVIRA